MRVSVRNFRKLERKYWKKKPFQDNAKDELSSKSKGDVKTKSEVINKKKRF